MNTVAISLTSLFLSACAAGPVSTSTGTLHRFTSDASGFSTNSFWYDDGQEVLVVDAQFTPAIARALVAEIQRSTTSPITRVVVTHPNPDKFNGLSVFHALGATSIGAEATQSSMPGVDAYKRGFWIDVAKAFSAETYPAFEPLRTTFVGQTTIHLASGETVTLLELPRPGISSNQTVVRFDATGDLVVGDLVHHGAHAWLEGGIVNGKAEPNLDGWRADLEALTTLGATTVHGGRGESAPLREAVDAQVAYLNRAEAIVEEYLASLGGARTELLDASKAGAHYAELQRRFVAAYPTHALPDLIGYGIYGLVMKKLAEPTR